MTVFFIQHYFQVQQPIAFWNKPPERTSAVRHHKFMTNVIWDQYVDLREEERRTEVNTEESNRIVKSENHSQPFARAIRAASTRLAAPSLLMASER